MKTETEVKHTPGPWFVDSDIASQVCQPNGSKRRRIKCPPDANGIADARLIAAAPDLLEALAASRGQWIHSVNAEKCLAAIAKAEGKYAQLIGRGNRMESK